MFATLLSKEIRDHLQTFRFGAAMITVFVLILFSVWVLGGNYVEKVKTFETLAAQFKELQESVRVPSTMEPTIGYEPSRLSVFAQAESRLFGNFIEIEHYEVPHKADIRLTNNELLEATNTFDLQMVVTIVLSLFAVLMSYDAISGEREQGTLKQVMSYSVSRAQIFLAKFTSLLIVIAIPVIISMLCSLIILQLVFGISFVGAEWLSFGMMFISTIIYAAVFIALGMLCSATMKRASTSIVAAILFWALLVFFLPLAANRIAGMVVPLKNPDEIANARISTREEKYSEINNFRGREMDGMFSNVQIRNGYMNNNGYYKMYVWDANPQFFRIVSKLIPFTHPVWLERATNIWSLIQEHIKRKEEQSVLAERISFISPAFQVRMAFTNLAGSGYDRYAQFLEEARRYRQQFLAGYANRGYFSDNVVGYVSRLRKEEALSEEAFERRMQELQKLSETVNIHELDPDQMWAMHGDIAEGLVPEFAPQPILIKFEEAILNVIILVVMMLLLLFAGLVATNSYDVR